MNKWRRLVLLPALLAVASAALPQDAQAPDAVLLKTLVTELRLLRQAIERRSAFEARAQLLVSRVTLQDQRLSRLRSEAQGLEAELSNTDAERSRLLAGLSELQQALDGVSTPDRRTPLEWELRRLRSELQRNQTRHGELAERRAQTAEAVETERARYEQMQAALDQLDRELERPSR